MNDNAVFVKDGSVTSPAGFLASGVTAGFKRSGAPDAALVVSEKPANFAGGFTRCLFAAAPVQLCRERAAHSETVRAFFINSGNANACTGAAGLSNARKTCAMVASQLGCREDEVLVASTGRIGTQMPMDVVERGVELACTGLVHDGGCAAARAIMTTDTVPKSAAVVCEFGGRKVTIGAMSKGAGMIDPELKVLHATMISCITTDAAVSNSVLADLLENAAGESFNRITVDGDMSTNDTAIIMANGVSGVEITSGSPEYAVFASALTQLLRKLAREMVMDGEGATKFVTVKIVNAPSRNDARLCAEAVANSLLCKTAWFGCDPNWGRVVAALGYSRAEFDPDKVDIFYDKIPVVHRGGDAGTPEDELAGVMKQRELTVLVDMNSGDADYWVWTSDISYEYVKINADYHT